MNEKQNKTLKHTYDRNGNANISTTFYKPVRYCDNVLERNKIINHNYAINFKPIHTYTG